MAGEDHPGVQIRLGEQAKGGALSLRYSEHARLQMRRRRVSETEVEEAWREARIETPGRSPNEVNLWGYTSSPRRRLRITVRSHERDYVITVVAPEEGP